MSTFAYFSISRRSLTILNCQRSATIKNVIDRRHEEPSVDMYFIHIYQYLNLRFGDVWISLSPSLIN
jgi:hypothetical protein